jgi:hypothetical protein
MPAPALPVAFSLISSLISASEPARRPRHRHGRGKSSATSQIGESGPKFNTPGYGCVGRADGRAGSRTRQIQPTLLSLDVRFSPKDNKAHGIDTHRSTRADVRLPHRSRVRIV